jgi:hypothetical protein
MFIFGSGMSAAPTAYQAAHEAASRARDAFTLLHRGSSAPGAGKSRPSRPKLAIVFASLGYDDAAAAPHAVRELIGDVPIVGGSAGGCVIGSDTVTARGVSVILLGGDDLEVSCESAGLSSPELVDVVPAASRIARAADDAARRGLSHYVCLSFAPGIFVDGEALVAAIRKGAGARAQLAGALTGDELTMDRPGVFVREADTYALTAGQVVLAGLFTKKPIGIAARHGWRAVGPSRTVTRAEGPVVFALDRRPVLDVWLEDARAAGARLPTSKKDLLLYLANHYELGIDTRGNGRELVVRAPWSIGADNSITLSGSIGEGRKVRVVHASRKDLLRASADATSDAVLRVGHAISGALVLACAGRLAALGDDFAAEPAAIQRRIAAPIGGASVFGEIARNERDVDAFFNTTTVVVAFPT